MPNYLFPVEFQSKNSIISGACTFKTISATPSFLPLFLYFSVKTLANFYYGTLWETADSAFDMQESSVDNCCFFTCSSLASSSKCQLKSFFIGITLLDVHLNWLNWFYLLILEGGLLVILIDCIIFQTPFLDVTTMSMSIVSFHFQLDS